MVRSFLVFLFLVAILGVSMLPKDVLAAPVYPPSFAARIALVTGGNKGIGKEIARSLAEEDSWLVFLASRDKKNGDDAAREINDAISKIQQQQTGESAKSLVLCCPLDLTDEESIVKAKELIASKTEGRLDVLINNAAVCFNDPTLYGKVPYTPFEGQASITIRTNFFGTLAVTQAMLPLLKQSDSPRIINIASSAGRLAILKSQEIRKAFTSDKLQIPELEDLMEQFVRDVEAGVHASKGWPNTCYGTSKLGIITLTKILARENNNNKMMVNAVDPGYCATDQNNKQGVLPPEVGAAVPVALATLPKERFVTGGYFSYTGQPIQW